MQPQQPVQLTVEAAPHMLDVIDLRLEEWVLTSTRYVDAARPQLAFIVDMPQLADIQALITQIDATATQHVTKLADIDWVEKVQKDFPPFVLGSFYVYGAHAKHTVPKNRHALMIDAVSAFGTGEHSTTAGCLLALEEIKKKRPHVAEMVDVGCGTAILAIGAARLWKNARIEGCDNDPKAVEVSLINMRVNGIASRSKAWVSDGYRDRRMQRLGKQPLIVANILARPLMKMARAAANQLAPDGVLVLSGLLNGQEQMVLSAHRMQGLYLARRLRRGKWSILVLK